MSVILTDHRHIHFVGIGGIGMSALARHLLAQGYRVSGSDRQPGDQGAALQCLGAHVVAGHQAEYVAGADLLVVTSAIPSDNPEVLAALKLGIPIVKRAELLAAIMNPRRGVAVAGTHGKTSTSALISHFLVAAGLDPTILIGGISMNLGSNARIGRSELVVVEADEYDASFLRLEPEIAVITNVEPDHLDFYGSPEAVYDAFREFARRVKGTLVVCADDPMASAVSEASSAHVVTYGIDAGDWHAVNIEERDGHMVFTGQYGGIADRYETSLAGLHSVRNCLAALAVGNLLGVSRAIMANALAAFSGVERRCETIGDEAGILVIDDYGHHPSEIRTVLAALRARYSRPIRLVFQPHTFSRTKSLLNEFATSFEDADVVYLIDVYAARESDTLGISSRNLAHAAGRHHANIVFTATMDRTLDALVRESQQGDVVVTMGAGDVNLLGPRVLQGLRDR